MRVEEASRREFYLTESADFGWTSRQLERQMNSFFYERLLATQASGRQSCPTKNFCCCRMEMKFKCGWEKAYVLYCSF